VLDGSAGAREPSTGRLRQRLRHSLRRSRIGAAPPMFLSLATDRVLNKTFVSGEIDRAGGRTNGRLPHAARVQHSVPQASVLLPGAAAAPRTLTPSVLCLFRVFAPVRLCAPVCRLKGLVHRPAAVHETFPDSLASAAFCLSHLVHPYK
jgi:hypothetical protein